MAWLEPQEELALARNRPACASAAMSSTIANAIRIHLLPGKGTAGKDSLSPILPAASARSPINTREATAILNVITIVHNHYTDCLITCLTNSIDTLYDF